MSDYPSEYAKLVFQFSKDMLEKLNANVHKRSKYKDISLEWLEEKLEEELAELKDALASDLPFDVIHECADVANVVMFIAYRMRNRDE